MMLTPHVYKIVFYSWSRTAPKGQTAHKANSSEDANQNQEEFDMVHDTLIALNDIFGEHRGTFEALFLIGAVLAAEPTFFAFMVFSTLDGQSVVELGTHETVLCIIIAVEAVFPIAFFAFVLI